MQNDLKTRLITLFNGLSIPKIAEKMEIPYSTLMNWVTGRTDFPPAELAKIARLSGGSITWLLIEEGEPFINTEPQVSFDNLLDGRIKAAVREEIIRGAVTVRDIRDESFEYEVLNGRFGTDHREILFEVAKRIREAINAADEKRDKKYDLPILESSAYIGKAVEQMENGEMPEKQQFHNNYLFLLQLFTAVRDFTRYKIKWLLTGEGDKTYPLQSEYENRFNDSKSDELLIRNFIKTINIAKKREEQILESQKKITRENILRQLIREIVQEELNKSKSSTSFTVKGKINEAVKERRKAS